MATATATKWALRGTGYEFCNCDFGCGCNFGGFPNSKDGSCRAFVGFEIAKGSAGGVDLSGVKCAAVLDWPKAIHEGNGKCGFVVDPATTDAQVEMLAQIFTGTLGGMPQSEEQQELDDMLKQIKLKRLRENSMPDVKPPSPKKAIAANPTMVKPEQMLSALRTNLKSKYVDKA